MNNKYFKKEDLQNGMVVELRNGMIYMVLNDNLIRISGFTPLNSYNQSLKNIHDNRYDIVKIYKSNSIDLDDIFNKDYLELIWEYEEEVDWSKIPVDTKILVSVNGIDYYHRHFAKYDNINNKIFAWDIGRTSFTTTTKTDCAEWKYAKLYKPQDE